MNAPRKLTSATVLGGALVGPALLLARLLMSVEFLLFGSLKIANSARMQGYMEAQGVPGELIWLAVLVQLGAGTMLLVGYRTRLAALALAGFCVVATLIFHTHFADLGEVSDFTKDLATTGGFICLCVLGPGPLSIDAWLDNKQRA